MNDIKWLTADIPDVMDEVMDAINEGDEKDVELTVGDGLTELGEKVNQCKELAVATKAKYDHVIEVIKEVLEATTATKGTIEQKDRELREQQILLRASTETYQQAHRQAEERQKKMEEEIQEAKQGYIAAKENMPGTGTMVGLSVLDTIEQIAMMPIKILTAIPKLGSFLFKNKGGSGDGEGAGKDTLVSQAVAKAQMQIDQAREDLHRYEEQKMAEEKEAQEAHEKMMTEMAKLRNIDFSRTDIESVKEALRKGLQALVSVQVIWTRLALFFSEVVSIVNRKMGQDVIGFTRKTKNYLKHESDFQRGLMFKCLSQATQSAIVVNSLAGTYVEISTTYLMPPLTHLPSLMYPQPGTSINHLARQLDRECDQSMRNIHAIATQRRQEVRTRLQAKAQAQLQY